MLATWSVWNRAFAVCTAISSFSHKLTNSAQAKGLCVLVTINRSLSLLLCTSARVAANIQVRSIWLTFNCTRSAPTAEKFGSQFRFDFFVLIFFSLALAIWSIGCQWIRIAVKMTCVCVIKSRLVFCQKKEGTEGVIPLSRSIVPIVSTAPAPIGREIKADFSPLKIEVKRRGGGRKNSKMLPYSIDMLKKKRERAPFVWRRRD